VNQPQQSQPQQNQPPRNQPQRNQPQRNQPQRNQHGQQRRQRRPKPPPPVDIWRTAPELPAVEPIVVPAEVDALLRSLGEAPSIGGSAVADHYFAAVVQRTAAVARALALSADLLAEPE